MPCSGWITQLTSSQVDICHGKLDLIRKALIAQSETFAMVKNLIAAACNLQ